VVATRSASVSPGPIRRCSFSRRRVPFVDNAVHAVVDGGLDDALALAVLVALEVPLVQVVATEGSMDLLTTARTTRRFLQTVHSQVPVRLGTDQGIVGPYPEGRDPFHGPDCFGGAESLLDDAAIPDESNRALDGRIFCSGALTVVAQAMAAGRSLSEVLWMGGAVAVGGNMTAAAEFNAWMDPSATDQVLTGDTPVRVVPLDITIRFLWTSDHLDRLRATGRVGAILAQALGFLVDRDGIFVPHDAVAALAMTSPELFTWRARPARCESTGLLTSGATVIDRRPGADGAGVLVAEDVEVTEVSARIVEAITRLA
jgi:pyrimidine-specific ribonucleoside hydrolase